MLHKGQALAAFSGSSMLGCWELSFKGCMDRGEHFCLAVLQWQEEEVETFFLPTALEVEGNVLRFPELLFTLMAQQTGVPRAYPRKREGQKAVKKAILGTTALKSPSSSSLCKGGCNPPTSLLVPVGCSGCLQRQNDFKQRHGSLTALFNPESLHAFIPALCPMPGWVSKHP